MTLGVGVGVGAEGESCCVDKGRQRRCARRLNRSPSRRVGCPSAPRCSKRRRNAMVSVASLQLYSGLAVLLWRGGGGGGGGAILLLAILLLAILLSCFLLCCVACYWQITEIELFSSFATHRPDRAISVSYKNSTSSSDAHTTLSLFSPFDQASRCHVVKQLSRWADPEMTSSRSSMFTRARGEREGSKSVQ